MNKKVKLLINLWLPVILWCALIFFLSSQLAPPPTGNLFFDLILPHLGHLFEYGVLFALIWRGSKNISLSFLLGVLYAFSDEFHQSFVPTRTPSLIDILIDISGMLFAYLALWKLLPKTPKKLKNWAKKLDVI